MCVKWLMGKQLTSLLEVTLAVSPLVHCTGTFSGVGPALAVTDTPDLFSPPKRSWGRARTHPPPT